MAPPNETESAAHALTELALEITHVAPSASADSAPPNSRSFTQPGALIKHYELIRKVGEGGMGEVFLARDTRLGRRVAIKFLHEQSGIALDRFLAEARATALCQHENIVVIHDVGDISGYPYMVLEYIEGRTLRVALHERMRADNPEGKRAAHSAIELMIPVVRALSAAHAMNLVHRDLKPENILLSNSGLVKVVDFGIAKQLGAPLALARTALQSEGSGPFELTREGETPGTMMYMSPEQWLSEAIDERTDIWAAGLILFELLIGEHPLAPINMATLKQVAKRDIPMPSAKERRPDAAALGEIIDRCLKKRKEERYGSAQELCAALEALVADQRVPSLSEQECPFAGLSAFQEADAGRYFGREQDISAVIGKLRNQELVAIVGPSGAGKSSFVRAGVIPALKNAGRRLEACVIRPGRRPLAALADALSFFADTAGDVERIDSAALEEKLLEQPGYLGVWLRARCRRRGREHRVLLFVDQFEELYTLGIEPKVREAFCASLLGVADDASSPLRVILSMRADFLDRLAEDRTILSEVTRGLYFLPPMSAGGLRDALKKPLEGARYRFEDEILVDEILGSLVGMKSPLPIMQFLATKLWEARDKERRMLATQAYRVLGGVAGALSTHANAVLAGMSPIEQKITRAILLRLVTPERTRAMVLFDELCALSEDRPAVEHAVQRLADARLISIETGDEREGKTVELVHESLIERWGKLRGWLDAEEQDAQFLAELRSAAAQWEKNGHAPGFLWRDETARKAASWLEGRKVAGKVDIGTRELGYLEAVVRLEESTRRRQKRVMGGIIAFLSIIALVVSLLGVQAKRQATRADAQTAVARESAEQAQRNADKANESAAKARNATRVAAARAYEADPTIVLGLLREIEPGSVPRGWAELGRWAKEAGAASVVLRHDEQVKSAIFSPEGKRILTASLDHVLRVWNADGSGEALVLRGHDGDIYAEAWSPDGKRIVSASQDMTVRVWNADGSGEALVLRGHERHVYDVSFSPDGKRIVSASQDKTVRLWNADGSGEPQVFRGHEDIVGIARFSPDGNRIVSGAMDKTARVWDADGSGEPIVLRGHEEWLYAAAFSPDGKRIVTASKDKTVRVWNADGSGEPLVLRGHDDQVMEAAFSPDGQRIVSASRDNTARVWNADGSGEPLVLRGHTLPVIKVAFGPDGRRIATASEDKTVRLWDIVGSSAPVVLRGHAHVVQWLSWSADGRRIVTASQDATARVWSADADVSKRVFSGHDEAVYKAAFSADGKRIVSASQDNTVRVWNADGSGMPIVLRGHENAVYAAVFSPDGKRIASASGDKTVRVWNADGSGESLVLRGHERLVYGVAFSPDGQRIASASGDNTVRVWNADGIGEPFVFRGHTGFVSSATWSPDGQHIVSTSVDKTARVWNANGSGKPVVLPHDDQVDWAAFSPDSKHIITATDNMTRVWNADGSGEPVVTRGHEALVGVRGERVFSPDGKRIALPSNDGTARVWNADGTGEPIVLRASNLVINKVSFSPDGKRLVAASDDKSVIVWGDLEPLEGGNDPRLWKATSWCMPLELRQRLLDFPEAQSKADLERCKQRVREILH